MVLPTPQLDVGWGCVILLDDDGLALGALAWEIVDIRQRGTEGEAKLV